MENSGQVSGIAKGLKELTAGSERAGEKQTLMGYVILLWHSLSLPYNYLDCS